MNNKYDELRFNASAGALLDQWAILRAPGSLCPAKQDFNPMTMGKYLPDVFMAEFVDEDHVIIRVAGSRTTDVTLHDTTGNNIMDNKAPGNRETLKHFYEKMRSGRYAGISENRLTNATRPSNAVALQLPLLDPEGRANFFVGVIKAVPIEVNTQNIVPRMKKTATIIRTSFTNLSVCQAPIELKIG